MKLLEEKIRKDGKVLPGNILKVDSFLNHQIDVKFLCEIGQEFRRLFLHDDITKILTIEASGIGIACMTALYFDVPAVFAKKSKTTNMSTDVYTASVYSYTHNTTNQIRVSKEFLGPQDKVLIVDDFLANGCALKGLIELIQSAGATVAGVGIVIEKAFQPGGKLIRDMGVRVESLARVESMGDDGSISFCD